MPIHEPFDERLIPSDVQDAIDTCITSAIQSAPGLPLVNVLGATMVHLSESYNISTPLPLVINMRLEALTNEGQITRLTAQSGSKDNEECTYYPKGWRFAVEPRGLAINTTPKPAMLNSSLNDKQEISRAFAVQVLESIDKKTRVHVLNSFCIRCGDWGDQELHYCNE